MEQNRFKSWALWLSLAGALWVIICNTGLAEKIGITEGAFYDIVNAIGSLLVVFGIVNNPTDKQNF